MQRIILGAALAAACLSQAHAAAQKLSGTYLYAWHEFCGKDGGNISQALNTGLLTFDNASKTVTFQTLHGSFGSTKLTAESGSGSYSTTATTLTIGGEVNKAFYGDIRSGVAYQVVTTFAGKPTDLPCASQPTLTHQ